MRRIGIGMLKLPGPGPDVVIALPVPPLAGLGPVQAMSNLRSDAHVALAELYRLIYQ